jgi:hypothetical protein
VTFYRLRIPDMVAFVAALALMVVMATTWYTTAAGAEYRRDAGLAISGAATHGQGPDLKHAYNQAASALEKNPWQEHALIDRLILIALLVAAAAALVSGFARAAGKRFDSKLTPAAVASYAAAAAVLMLGYRILQPPGWNPGAVVRVGAPLGLLFVAVIALAERVAVHYERDGTEFAPVGGEEGAQAAPGSPAA